jgi:hypothetical protein
MYGGMTHDIFIINVPDSVRNVCCADKGQNLQKMINKVMSELDGWFNANSLTLNTEKTIVMAIHNRHKRDFTKPQIKFDKTEINKAVVGPSMQQFLSSSDVIATTCFGHTTIIMWQADPQLFC